jgi:hypothetical protein
LFYPSGADTPTEMPLEPDSGTAFFHCTVPPEVIKPMSFAFSVYSVNGAQRITTAKKTVYVQASGYNSGGVSPEPAQPLSLPVYTPSADGAIPYLRMNGDILQGSTDNAAWFNLTGGGSSGLPAATDEEIQNIINSILEE